MKQLRVVTNTASVGERGVDVLTFLFADIRGYTRFTQTHGDEVAARLAMKFAAIARELTAARDGEVIELRGDEVLAVFSSARQALRAAVELQLHFASETAADPSLPIEAGIGLDAGEAVRVEGGYRGGALNLAARLCSLAGPGEVLSSEVVTHLAGKMEGIDYAERGPAQLKGFTDPVQIIRVFPEGHAPAEGERREPAVTGPGRVAPASAGEQHLPIGGFLGSLPSGPFVGRVDELRQILAAVDSAAEGQGRGVLLCGEPGAGKTRLAQEATLHARNRHFLIAAGRCYEAEQSVPYYPFLDVLSSLYTLAPATIQQETVAHRPYLGVLLPDYVDAPRNAGGDQDEQQRVFRAAAAFLQAMAQTVPIAILLDDLHWADSASLRLLLHLARHTRTSRILILGTYRDVEVQRQHPLEAALRDLSREQLVERVAVRRLDLAGTAALMAATIGGAEISDDFAELIHGRTEGNPFFVQQVLRVLVDRGDVYRQDGRWTRKDVGDIEVPESVRAVIGQRLSRLSASTQEVLHEASVLGQSFRFDDLQALSNRAEQELETAVDEAELAGLVRASQRDSYSFDHALTQQALYAELSSRRRRRLHLAAAEALERLPEQQRTARAAELARHFLEGDEPERALPYSILAGDGAEAVFAHAEAEHRYRTALELAREIGDRAREVAALERLGGILTITGRYEEALDLLEGTADLCRAADDADAEARIVSRIAHLYARSTRPDLGIARIQMLLDRLPREGDALVADQIPSLQPPSHGLAAVYVALAHLYLVSGRYRETLGVSDRATDLASAVHDDRLLAKVESHRGAALLELAQLADAARVLEDAVPVAERTGDADSLAIALSRLGQVCQHIGDFERSDLYYKRLLDLTERLGDPIWIATALAGAGSVRFFSGEWEEAGSYFLRGVDVIPAEEASWLAAYPLFGLGALSLAQGDWEAAARYLDQGIAMVGDSIQMLRVAHWALAELDLVQEHPDEALRHLEPLLDRPGLEELNVTMLLPLLARAHLAKGESDRAAEILERGVDRAMRQNDRLNLVDLLWIQAWVMIEQRRWEKARRALDHALSVGREIGYRYGEARALYQYGRLEAARSAPAQARERLEEALTIFRQLGARPYVERAERELTRLSQS